MKDFSVPVYFCLYDIYGFYTSFNIITETIHKEMDLCANSI